MCAALTHQHLLIWRTQSSLNYREIRAGLRCLWESGPESSYYIHQRRQWVAPVATQPRGRGQLPIFWICSGEFFKAKNKSYRELTRFKLNVVLNFFFISSPKKPFPLKALYVKCVLDLTTWLHTLAKDVSRSPWVCVWRFFIVPASALQPAVCAVTH